MEVCPERGRRTLLRLHPRVNTDSTALGTAAHLGIELDLQSIIDGQGPLSLDAMLTIATEEFDELASAEDFKWAKWKTRAGPHAALARILDTYKQLEPALSPQAVEIHLGPTTIYEDSERVIQLEGTADYLDMIEGLADWKTAGREWDVPEHVRWDVQPTVYTWLYCNGDPSLVLPWTWHVFYTNGKYEKITTTRNAADWAWLQARCLNVVQQLEAELPEWILNPAHFLCSAKYCDAFKDCRGRFHAK